MNSRTCARFHVNGFESGVRWITAAVLCASTAACVSPDTADETEGDIQESASALTGPVSTLLHAPNGNWAQAHTYSYMVYTSWGGSFWCARLYGNTFEHAPHCDWAATHTDSVINYVTWDGGQWTATIDNGTFTHAPSGNFALSHTDTILNYQSWNNGNWSVKVAGTTTPIVKPGHSFALNLSFNAHADGAVVNLWEQNGHASQSWTFGADGRIHPSGDTQFCLAHWGNANAPVNGSAAVLWSCVDHDSQRWAVWADGTIRKQSNPNKCLNLDYNAYENGHVVDVYDCNGHESQKWTPQAGG